MNHRRVLEYSRRVAAMRSHARMTQRAVADDMRTLGYPWTQQTVDAIESGSRQLKLVEAVDLCGVLGVDLWRITRDTFDTANELQELRDFKRRVLHAVGGDA